MRNALFGIILAAIATQAQAGIIISEVAPWSSSNSPVTADWFEITNTGNSAINIGGWKMDDNSNSFALSVALNGVTTINAGQSAVFVEGTATTANNFVSDWFGASAPANFLIGFYSGANVGLSATADAVNIYNSSGVLQANVSFGVSDATSPFQTFDNAAGLNNATISQLSILGVNGAFVAATSGTEIGSPGQIAAVPEPETSAMLMGGLGFMGFLARRRKA